MSRKPKEPSVVTVMDGLKADYTAGKRSRLLRERTNLGGSGDAHLGGEADFERIREFVRDMDRNDAIVGPFVDRAVVNQIQTGFRVQPNTGDESLDDELKARFAEWAGDKRLADVDWERTFWQQCVVLLRSTYVDGDAFALLSEGGGIQILESDRCRSPSRSDRSVVHGVELDGRRKTAFHFSTDPGTARQARGATTRRRAYDEAGNAEVLHVYNPQTTKRITQSRGVSAFAPVFFRLGMHEDTQFATLVQRQTVAMIAFFFERGAEWQGGKATLGRASTDSVVSTDENSSTVEKVSPGMVVRGAKGEKMSAVPTNVPSPEYFPFVKLILTEVGINIGVPLVLALMDASETNFSGFRGAVDAARMGFRVNQKWFAEQFLGEVWRWKVRQWAEESPMDGGLGDVARRLPTLQRHIWTAPNWPYIQPLDDANANVIRLDSAQISPSAFAREQGFDWSEHIEEVVSDNAFAIREAKRLAAAINGEWQDNNPVHWRELLSLGLSGSAATMAATRNFTPNATEATNG